MTITRIHAVIAFILMVCAVAGAHLWRPTAHLADTRAKIELEQMFPAAFGDFNHGIHDSAHRSPFERDSSRRREYTWPSMVPDAALIRRC